MERAVEILAAIHFFILGMSHILQPRAWAKFFIKLRELGEPGNFMNAFLNLAFGSLVVAFHNVWTGIPAVLTVIGWAQVVKSLIYFLAPSVGLKALNRISLDNAKMFIAPGVMLVAVSGLLVYHLLTG